VQEAQRVQDPAQGQPRDRQQEARWVYVDVAIKDCYVER
jgi:hypothetical protein